MRMHPPHITNLPYNFYHWFSVGAATKNYLATNKTAFAQLSMNNHFTIAVQPSLSVAHYTNNSPDNKMLQSLLAR